MDGIEQLICCSVEGEIRGYKAMSTDAIEIASDRNVNQEALREMNQRKQVT
jgi:Bardet-Biedl syndrome 2 protein